MKMTLRMLVPAALLFAATASLADHHETEAQYVPVHTWTCTFKDGKTMNDLNPVIDQWNEWMDDNGADDYSAITVMPHYFGQQVFDVGWLGVWKDGNAMGRGTDMWVNSGAETAANFWEVLDCQSHTNYATMVLSSAPEDEEDDKNFVLTFSDCSVTDGNEFSDVMSALGEWITYQEEEGFEFGAYVMFPVYGATEEDYDFKLVQSYDDHATLGAVYEQMGNGGHWRKRAELLGDSLDCNSARVYNAVEQRAWAENE